MSFSAGVFSINSTGQPVVTGTVISSTVFNALTADLATGLSTCVLKDGTQTITTAIPMSGFKITGLGAATLVGDAVRADQLRLSGISWAVAAGTADAITATYSPVNASLTDGLLLGFRASAANTTTTPTFAPDGLTAHTITQQGGQPLFINEIPGALAECLVRYNLANTRWELLNPSGVQGTFTITLTGVNATVTATAIYEINNNVVTLWIPAITGTSNTTACTLTGIPAAITPATKKYIPVTLEDNSVAQMSNISIDTNNIITLYTLLTSATFTNTGIKGLLLGAIVSYSLA